jgi:hypothetical protein
LLIIAGAASEQKAVECLAGLLAQIRRRCCRFRLRSRPFGASTISKGRCSRRLLPMLLGLATPLGSLPVAAVGFFSAGSGAAASWRCSACSGC